MLTGLHRASQPDRGGHGVAGLPHELIVTEGHPVTGERMHGALGTRGQLTPRADHARAVDVRLQGPVAPVELVDATLTEAGYPADHTALPATSVGGISTPGITLLQIRHRTYPGIPDTCP